MNNSLDNLEWCTYSHNIKHACDNGLLIQKTGINNETSKLSIKDVEYIRKHYQPRNKEFGARPLGKKFNVSHQTILNVISRKTYNDVA